MEQKIIEIFLLLFNQILTKYTFLINTKIFYNNENKMLKIDEKK